MKRSTRRRLTAAALAALPLASPIMAQDAFLLDEITVFANRTPTELARTGTSVEVVTEEELDAAGDVQLATFLARLPGVSITQEGPLGNNTNVRIRGADSRYIPVYIDGIRVTDPTQHQTAFNFGHLTTGDIGRVEVLRGSQSALYGGSAVGGVISITTRAPDEPGVTHSAEVEAGSYDTLRARYTLGWRGERHQTAFTISGLRTEGFSAADENDGSTEPDGYRGGRLSFSTRYQVSDTLALGAAAFAQRDRQEHDGFDPVTWAPADTDHHQNRREAGARLFAELSFGMTEHMFELTGYTIAREFVDDSSSKFRGRRLGFAWQGTTEIDPTLTLVYGADTMQEMARYDALAGGPVRSRTSGAFVQSLWAPTANLDVAATARMDHTSNFGSFATGRLALAWRPAPDWTIRAVAASGFRPPSIDERYGVYPDPFFPFHGNPDLEPERSRSYEVGIERAFAGGGQISGTAFLVDIDNLITSTGDTLTNLPGRSTRRGLELSAALPLGERVTLNGGYTYIDARDRAGARLGGVPRHDLALALNADVTDRLSGVLSLHHIAARPREWDGTEMPDYTVVNTSFRYALTDAADLTFRVDNLFNAQYQQAAGYGTSDRAFYIGAAARF